jgi:hypothetical protein
MANSEANKKKKRKIIFTIISIVGVGAAIYLLIKLLENQDALPHISKWLEQQSNDKINAMREEARLKHCSGDENATRFMDLIDTEIRRRDNIGRENEAPGYPVHREHGWHLLKDD